MSSQNVKELRDKDMAELLGNNKESAEYNRKKQELEQESIATRHEQMLERKAQIEAFKSFNLDTEEASIIQKIADDNEDYLLKAKNAKNFLNDSFRGKVPLFPRNVILAAAETGVGKSTVTTNLAFRAMMQGQRVLIISNEENEGDFYNRITCLIKGWAYINHSDFTDEQRKVFKEMTVMLDQRIKVVGNTRGNLTNLTTTIEGVETVLNSVLVNNSKFDLIVIDYYQNIDRSEVVPTMLDWQAQYRFCKFIDQYKNRSNAAIVVLAQLKTAGDAKALSFKDAIEGRKTIMNVATCVLRIKKEAENQRTGFEIMKSRFLEGLGETIWVGFKRGKYVDYDAAFKNEVELAKIAKATRDAVNHVKPTNGG